MVQKLTYSDRVVLIDWRGEVFAPEVLRLLVALGQARQGLGAPLVAILAIDPELQVPSARVRSVLADCLPLMLSRCQKFFIALGPVTLRHRFLRAFFLAYSSGVIAARRVQLCDSVAEALECAQRFAPQEVLQLQARLLKQGVQPWSAPCSVN